MFRTALLRSSSAAARTALRPVSSSSSTVARSLAIAPRTPSLAPRAAAFAAVRFYSSSNSLSKEDVYKRIATLLTGFDKVCFFFLFFSPYCYGRRGAEKGTWPNSFGALLSCLLTIANPRRLTTRRM